MKKSNILHLAALLGLLTLAPSALAHHAESMSGKPFVQGLSMPIHGIDHLLAAFAVGLIAAQARGRAKIQLPLLFALTCLAGALFNITGISLPELAIPAATLSLSLVLWRGAARGWMWAALAIMAAGFFNGHALIEAAPTSLSTLLFAAGCVLSALAAVGVGYASAGALRISTRPTQGRWVAAALVASAAALALFPEINGALIQLLEGSR